MPQAPRRQDVLLSTTNTSRIGTGGAHKSLELMTRIPEVVLFSQVRCAREGLLSTVASRQGKTTRSVPLSLAHGPPSDARRAACPVADTSHGMGYRPPYLSPYSWKCSAAMSALVALSSLVLLKHIQSPAFPVFCRGGGAAPDPWSLMLMQCDGVKGRKHKKLKNDNHPLRNCSIVRPCLPCLVSWRRPARVREDLGGRPVVLAPFGML